MPNGIHKVEAHIDKTLEGLPIFRVPRYQALAAILADLEMGLFHADQAFGRRSPGAYVNALHRKPAAALLGAQAWQRCPIDETYEEKEDALTLAHEASLFSVAYFLLSDVFPSFHRKELTASRSARLIEFQYTSAKSRTHDALNFLSQLYRRRHPPEQREDVDRIITLQTQLAERVKREIEIDAHIPLFTISDETLACSLQLAEAEIRRPSLRDDTACGGYDVASFRAMCLALRAIGHIAYAVWELLGVPCVGSGAIWGPVVWYSAEDFPKLLSQLSHLDGDTVTAILRDLTFNPDNSRSDLELSPIVIFRDQYWLPPHIILTYRWEDNLMRLWSAGYPKEYGRNVAIKKKGLSAEVAKAFKGKPFKISTPDREIKDADGKPITDVDLAVASPADHIILLLETKWPISPATPKEASKTDEEIEVGFTQLAKAQSAISGRQSETLRQIFPLEDVEGWRIDDVRCVELVRGVYPSASVSMAFPVVPVDAAIDYIHETSEETLLGIANDLEDPPEDRLLSELREYEMALTIAGFEIRIPQWSWTGVLAEAVERAVRPGRNSRCPCGSGVKYKRCCQLATRSNRYTWTRIVSDIERPS